MGLEEEQVAAAAVSPAHVHWPWSCQCSFHCVLRTDFCALISLLILLQPHPPLHCHFGRATPRALKPKAHAALPCSLRSHAACVQGGTHQRPESLPMRAAAIGSERKGGGGAAGEAKAKSSKQRKQR